MQKIQKPIELDNEEDDIGHDGQLLSYLVKEEVELGSMLSDLKATARKSKYSFSKQSLRPTKRSKAN